jgi:copper transport protein
VLDAQGNPVAGAGAIQFGTNDHEMTLPLPALKPGIYNVTWSNVSRVDGHALQGSYPFTVLNPDGSVPSGVNQFSGTSSSGDIAPSADGVAVRALSLLGLAVVAGAALLSLLGGEALRDIRRGLEYTMYAGAGLLLIATILNIAQLNATFASESLGHVLFQTALGGYVLGRLGVAILLVLLASLLRESPRRASWGIAIGGVVYLWAYTQTSHAAAGAGSFWARGFDIIHAVAAIAWIGALIGLLVCVRLLRRNGDYRHVVPRFSLMASVLVFVLIATGFFSTFVEVDTPSKLLDTRYGLTLSVKLGLVFVLLLPVALYNTRVASKRLIALAPGEPRRFMLSAGTEAVLGILVFAAAAVLTQTTVSKTIATNTSVPAFDHVQTSAGINVALHIDPNRTGMNTYRVTLTDPQGNLTDAERVALTFRYQDNQSIGASDLVLDRVSNGVFSGQGPYLLLEGHYQVQVDVRRANVDDVNVFFDDRPAGPPVAQLRAGGQWDNPTPGMSWNELGGIFLLVVGLGCALWRGRIGNVNRRAGWAANGGVLLGFGIGILLLFGVHSHTPLGGLPSNPIPADSASIAAGKALFEPNCSACHGIDGHPPSGLKLNPYPLDLTVHAPLHSDGVLYNFIAHGIVGTAMPAWLDENKLTPEQIWNIVNFLRTLGSVPGPAGASGPAPPTP